MSSSTKRSATKGTEDKRSTSKASSGANRSASKAAAVCKKAGSKPSGVAEWGGKMTCNVQNRTGGQIALVAQHVLGSQVNNFAFTVMENNESINFTIDVGSGANDYWSVWMMKATSVYYCHYDDKKCNVDEEDWASKKPVNLVMRAGNFSISIPVSSSCNDIVYSQCLYP